MLVVDLLLMSEGYLAISIATPTEISFLVEFLGKGIDELAELQSRADVGFGLAELATRLSIVCRPDCKARL